MGYKCCHSHKDCFIVKPQTTAIPCTFKYWVNFEVVFLELSIRNFRFEQKYLYGAQCMRGGEGELIKGGDDQGPYFFASPSSCCYINNANVSAIFPLLRIHCNGFSRL